VTHSTQPGGIKIDTTGDILFVSRKQEMRYANPVAVIAARSIRKAPDCIARIEAGVAQGLHAAGFIAYEAAPGFNDVLETHAPGELPLLWFALYEHAAISQPVTMEKQPFRVGGWTAEVTKERYLEALAEIRELIAAGHTYQVNYTFPMHATFEGDALSWFRGLCEAQRTDYAAFIDAGRFKILSASPELFFRLDGERLETRPMKGTRPRGRWMEEDLRLAEELRTSEKDRAENVMIVDLLRNDMGRVSESGSVRVASLFEIERYETLWQMTSSITSTTRASLPEILAALFPSGSVTGAPKVRTMQIIRRLESFPRGVYCGAVGWWTPDRRAEFNVAIRTVTVDSETGIARYHVGGGITWGSTPESEFEECHVKAAVLTQGRPEFELLESLLFDRGYFLLEEHIERLASSAEYFGFDIEIETVRAALVKRTATFGPDPLKVRLLVKRDGSFRIESAPATPSVPVKLGFAAEPVDDRNVFLFHKTTHRSVYEHAKASHPDCDDVLLWNQRGEITESTRANVLLNIGGEWLTPPVSSGLLPGAMRAHLLERGEIRETVLTKADLSRAASVALINSVRKWIEVRFVD